MTEPVLDVRDLRVGGEVQLVVETLYADETGDRTIWRWHFYAGLICLPFFVLLASTGAVYLFRDELSLMPAAAALALSVLAPQPTDG